MGAEQVGPFASTRKKSRPLPMNPRLPVLVDVPMAFATKPIAFFKMDQLSVVKTQLISVFCIMTIEAPSHRLGMAQLDLFMGIFQFPFFLVDVHGGMAATARVDPLCERRRRCWKLLMNLLA